MTINIQQVYAGTETAKIADLPVYEQRLRELITPGCDLILTGHGPIWLYLRLAHHLHGLARSLTYDSPVTGPVVIFDHNPH